MKLLPSKYSVYFLLSSIFAFALHPATAQQNENLHREINRILKNEQPVDFSIVPSIVVLTWDENRVMADTFGQPIPGYAHRNSFEWGGLTQPIVALLMEHALATNRLTVDSFIFSAMPDSIRDIKWKNITYRHLLEHRAGLPAFPAAMGTIEKDVEDPYRDFDFSKLNEEMKAVIPTANEFNYSNLGYAFLSWFFDPIGGIEKYAQYFFSHMVAGSFEFSFECNEGCLLPGYGLNGKPAKPWHTNAMQPALGIEGTPVGLYHFIQLWRKEYVKDMPPLAWFKKELAANEKAKSYLMYHGWFAVQSGKTVILYHTGHTGGHQVSAAFLPKENKGVLIFSNGEAGSHDLCFSILTMLQRAKYKKH